jgi:hypothetical protein
MKYIAHRGNLFGPDAENENTEAHIKSAIAQGYDAEIDVWKEGDRWLLGHNYGKQETTVAFLKTSGLWIHAKNYEAFRSLLDLRLHCFYNERDCMALTSKGYIWTLIGEPVGKKSVAVLPEKNWIGHIGEKGDLMDCYGICSDYVAKYN